MLVTLSDSRYCSAWAFTPPWWGRGLSSEPAYRQGGSLVLKHQRAPLFEFLMRKLLSHIAYKIRRYPIERRENLEAIRNLKIDLAAGNEERTGYVDHYTDAVELDVWERYREAFMASELSEPVFRATYVRDLIRKSIPAGSTVLNFGCSYGWLEGQLSEYNMIGLDRSDEAMRKNRHLFPKATFIAGDMFDILGKTKIDAFCHINIGVYFLPKKIARIYAAARLAGATNIICFEPSGVSRQTGRYYEYSDSQQDPAVFRGPMLLNNYPHIMREAGFSVIHSDILHPPHPQPDFRSACFVGMLK